MGLFLGQEISKCIDRRENWFVNLESWLNLQPDVKVSKRSVKW
jgi:hypothetical protein